MVWPDETTRHSSQVVVCTSRTRKKSLDWAGPKSIKKRVYKYNCWLVEKERNSLDVVALRINCFWLSRLRFHSSIPLHCVFDEYMHFSWLDYILIYEESNEWPRLYDTNNCAVIRICLLSCLVHRLLSFYVNPNNECNSINKIL